MRNVGLGTFRASNRAKELINEVLESGRISYGPLCKRFESEFTKIHGCKYGVLSNSGTSSLHVAVQALKEINKWRDGSEVLVPSVTFVATINVLLHNNLKPVLVDVESDYYGMDPKLVEKKITRKTVAMIPVHLFGMPCQMDRLGIIAEQRGLKIIEDSCFTGNTLIPTKGGTKHIKEIKVGDRLLGFDGVSFKETTVTNTMSRLVPYTNLLVIKFKNGLIARCTREHPFYVNGKWVKAADLLVGDEVWQSTWSDYTTWRREYKLSEAGRISISNNMKKNNPSFRNDIIKKSATNREHRPSAIERRVILTCKEYNLPIEYVGDSSLWIGNNKSGFKNPDFVSYDKRIVFEVYDPTFHYHAGSYKRVDRNDEWKRGRADFYGKHGYKTVFIPLSGFVGRDKRRELAETLRESVSNGMEIISIKMATAGNVSRYNSGTNEGDGLVRVYNMHCEPHNNYTLTSGVLVHNCETMFATLFGVSVGSWGDVACFSTYVAHLISTGVGGMGITNSPEIAARMRSLVNHGRDGIYISIDDDNDTKNKTTLKEVVSKRFKFEHIGHSFRITELEAALALAQLEDYKSMIIKRQTNAETLTTHLRKIEAWLQLPSIRPGATHSYMMYPIMLKFGDKWALCNYLEQNGIETREMLPLTNQPCYKGMWKEKDYPVAQNINKNGFYVGCHQELNNEDMVYIAEKINQYGKDTL
jgi:dTDP-4-amino-4,6-dideoxygalactose transaminase